MEQKCNDPRNDEAMENHHSRNCLHLDSKQSYQQVIWRRNSFIVFWRPLTGLFLERKLKFLFNQGEVGN